MDLKKYVIKQTSEFENELISLYNYIFFYFKEINTAEKFYQKVQEKIYSLEYFPERYAKLDHFKYKSLRKLVFSNYIIIYEIQKDSR